MLNTFNHLIFPLSQWATSSQFYSWGNWGREKQRWRSKCSRRPAVGTGHYPRPLCLFPFLILPCSQNTAVFISLQESEAASQPGRLAFLPHSLPCWERSCLMDLSVMKRSNQLTSFMSLEGDFNYHANSVKTVWEFYYSVPWWRFEDFL